MLLVMNNTGQEFRDRYNGVDHVFPPGEEVEISFEAARHIFGYGMADKTQNLVRLGWMQSNTSAGAAMDRLGGFTFRDADIYVAPPPVAGSTEEGAEESSDLLQEGIEGSIGEDGGSPSPPILQGPRRGRPRRAALP